DKDGSPISLRAKIIRNPEQAGFILGESGVGGNSLNPYWKKIEDTARIYREVVRSPQETDLQRTLGARTEALTALKQAGLRQMLGAAQQQEPISQAEAEARAKSIAGIEKSIMPTPPKFMKPPSPEAQEILKRDPAFMVGPPLPQQNELKEHVDDLFRTGSKAKSMDEFAVEAGADIGLNRDDLTRTLQLGRRMNPQGHDTVFGAPDRSKSDDLTRFLLFALAFGPKQAYQIIMSERKERQTERFEAARAGREEARGQREEARGERDTRRLDLMERGQKTRETQFTETFHQRERLANIRANIQMLSMQTNHADRVKSMQLRPLLEKLDALSRQAQTQMMTPEAMLSNPAVKETLDQIEAVLNQ
ncbi:MAG: hypothetical protein ACRD1Z_16180, partial [Vicinamibacteria bacterium]